MGLFVSKKPNNCVASGRYCYSSPSGSRSTPRAGLAHRADPCLQPERQLPIPYYTATNLCARSNRRDGICTRLLDQRPFKSVGVALHTGWWRDLGLGWLVGILMIVLVSLLQLVSRQEAFYWDHLDVSGTT